MVGLLASSFKNRELVQGTIGDGKPGPKTTALRNDRDGIVRAGAIYPDNVAITPHSFKHFLKESGALYAKSYPEAYSKLQQHPFSKSDKQTITDALMAFPEPLRYSLMVRGDDYSVGIGLGHTGTASAISSMGFGELFSQVCYEIKKVLASDFGPDMIVFKKKMGMKDNSGVLLMPIYGDRDYVGGENGEKLICPPLSINYIGKVGGKAIISVGGGIGGANLKVHMPGYSSMHKVSREISKEMMEHAISHKMVGGVSELDGELNEAMTQFYPLAAADSLAERFMGINAIVDRIASNLGQRYLEIVMDDFLKPLWVVVQSAQVRINQITKPEVPKESLLADSLDVVGTGLKYTNQILFAGHTPTVMDIGFNRYNENYLLVLDVHMASMINMGWSLSSFSNAGAVVMEIGNAQYKLFSHLGGYFRELGIPVLSAKFDSKIKAQVGEKPYINRKCLVYANEFESEGFVAAA